MLATGMEAYAIALDETNVYWTDIFAGTVVATPKIGGPSTTLATSQFASYAITVARTNVYWTTQGCGTNGTVVTAPTSGGKVTTLASNQFLNMSVVVAGPSVYWLATGRLSTVPLSGGTVSTMLVGDLDSLASDGTNVYFIEHSSVVVMPGAGGPVSTIASTDPVVMTVTGSYLHGVDGNANAIRVPLTGGEVTTFASPTEMPSEPDVGAGGIGTDGTTVYWPGDYTVDGTEFGAIFAAPLDGGAVTTIASGYTEPPFIAVDSTGLYWTDYVAVMK